MTQTYQSFMKTKNGSKETFLLGINLNLFAYH